MKGAKAGVGALQTTLAGAGGAAAVGAVSLAGFEGRALLILVIGIVLVAVLVVMLLVLLKRRDRAMVEEGDEALKEEIRKRSGKGNPEALARVAALSAKLEEGIDRFRETRQSLTDPTLPWYLLVGETGSGKSYAIRKSGIDFAPGLNEEQQGTGGTINMDWWFANDGIILDTAGRLLVEQGESNSMAELKEFLLFLKKVRRGCPINGMLLVLPADSLLNDSRDMIEQKSGMITKRLDLIRRTLGIRFPVWVMVTKSDLIPGFRQFFNDLPRELQHQMLGWSNPGSLNEEFDPSAISAHLQVVRQRLVRRRHALLADPVHTEDPAGRRLDQVDALYEFPDAFLRVGPGLEQYLQKIFMKSRFSQEPLFLRGIYFTSAVEEGAALDEALAQLRGISMDELKREGASFRRDRAVFLTDLFNGKILAERGLVTRSSNPEAIPRQRKLAILGAGFSTVIALMGMTWFGQRQFNSQIRAQRTLWESMAAEQQAAPQDWRVVALDSRPGEIQYVYRGEEHPLRDGPGLLALMASQLQEIDDRPIKVPVVFGPVRWLAGKDPNENRRAAFWRMYDDDVLKPIVSAARTRLRADLARGQSPLNWSSRGSATLALAELMKVETLGVDPRQHVDLDRLLRYALAPAEVEKYAAQYATLRKLQERREQAAVYAEAVGLAAAVGSDAELTDKAARQMLAYWDGQIQGEAASLKGMVALRSTVEALEQGEDHLARFAADHPQAPRTSDEYNAQKAEYNARLKTVEGAAAALDAQLARTPVQRELGEAYRTEKKSLRESAAAACDVLLKAVSRVRPMPAGLSSPVQKLTAAQQQWEGVSHAADPLVETLSTMYANHLAHAAGEPRAYQQRLVLYQRTAQALDRPELASVAPLEPQALAERLKDMQAWRVPQAITDAQAALDKAPAHLPRLRLARDVCSYVLNHIAEPGWRAVRVQSLLRDLPRESDKWGEMAAAYAKSSAAKDQEAVKQPQVPFTGLEGAAYDARFSPQAVQLLTGLASLAQHLGDSKATDIIDREALSTLCAGIQRGPAANYRDEYIAYWSEDLDSAVVQHGLPDQWPALRQELRKLRLSAGDINEQLRQFSRDRITALQQLPLESSSAAGRRRDEAIKRLSRTLAVLEPRAYTDSCEKLCRAWEGLGDSAVAAKAALRQLPASEFDDDFIRRTGEVAYWRAVSLHALGTLASVADPPGAQQEVTAVAGKFPLVAWREGLRNDEMLSAEDLERLQKAVKQALRDAPTSSDGKTIAEGALTRDEPVDQELRKLRVITNRHDLERIEALLNSVSGCEVWVLDAADQDKYMAGREPAYKRWHSIAMQVGGSQQEKATYHEARLGTLSQPVADVSMKMRLYNSDAHFDLTQKMQTTWPAVELLQRGNAHRVDDEGKKWDVELALTDDKKVTRVLVLRLVFTGAVPPPNKWMNWDAKTEGKGPADKDNDGNTGH